ncbi:hypothetical protein N7492_009736 [Penicillium capsulatum]|uniref:Uncharacterized protein n=1 Tax=Penicillium capsulatum TaxID=69766 RepID=A0A9W9HMZ1_9EURO|nr:hypothetical protein N7492_010721 [Penicillium capsulatum]KAJ5152456.1 hypothetical protein N7492_009736 [Penicillium capsulatum]KAJ6114054.1 hypothetical protein N7512_007499 [Penicillium capsulatum]KAJ6114181.1 hypothetical protein N7512_007626 [Penicillium capsulatum]
MPAATLVPRVMLSCLALPTIILRNLAMWRSYRRRAMVMAMATGDRGHESTFYLYFLSVYTPCAHSRPLDVDLPGLPLWVIFVGVLLGILACGRPSDLNFLAAYTVAIFLLLATHKLSTVHEHRTILLSKASSFYFFAGVVSWSCLLTLLCYLLLLVFIGECAQGGDRHSPVRGLCRYHAGLAWLEYIHVGFAAFTCCLVGLGPPFTVWTVRIPLRKKLILRLGFASVSLRGVDRGWNLHRGALERWVRESHPAGTKLVDSFLVWTGVETSLAVFFVSGKYVLSSVDDKISEWMQRFSFDKFRQISRHGHF